MGRFLVHRADHYVSNILAYFEVNTTTTRRQVVQIGGLQNFTVSIYDSFDLRRWGIPQSLPFHLADFLNGLIKLCLVISSLLRTRLFFFFLATILLMIIARFSQSHKLTKWNIINHGQDGHLYNVIWYFVIVVVEQTGRGRCRNALFA